MLPAEQHHNTVDRRPPGAVAAPLGPRGPADNDRYGPGGPTEVHCAADAVGAGVREAHGQRRGAPRNPLQTPGEAAATSRRRWWSWEWRGSTRWRLSGGNRSCRNRPDDRQRPRPVPDGCDESDVSGRQRLQRADGDGIHQCDRGAAAGAEAAVQAADDDGDGTGSARGGLGGGDGVRTYASCRCLCFEADL